MTPLLDVLAFGAHPDDVELCAGGTICSLTKQGYRVGVADLTRGELGTRGTPELRAEEAARASEIMQLAVRENLGLPDGDIANTPGKPPFRHPCAADLAPAYRADRRA